MNDPMMPQALRCLEWREFAPGLTFADGQVLLAAVPVRNTHSRDWQYEFAVVTFCTDELSFSVECHGEPWCWDLADVQYFCEIDPPQKTQRTTEAADAAGGTDAGAGMPTT